MTHPLVYETDTLKIDIKHLLLLQYGCILYHIDLEDEGSTEQLTLIFLYIKTYNRSHQTEGSESAAGVKNSERVASEIENFKTNVIVQN